MMLESIYIMKIVNTERPIDKLVKNAVEILMEMK